MIKKITLFSVFSLLTSFTFSQQSYYDDVNLNLTGVSLKDELATKIINTHIRFLSYTPDVWNASKTTDVNPTNSSVLWEIGIESMYILVL